MFQHSPELNSVTLQAEAAPCLQTSEKKNPLYHTVQKPQHNLSNDAVRLPENLILIDCFDVLSARYEQKFRV